MFFNSFEYYLQNAINTANAKTQADLDKLETYCFKDGLIDSETWAAVHAEILKDVEK